MAMTRDQMDEYDRKVMGIMPPAPPVVYTPQPSPPMTDVEGRPITRSYSLDDIRRFLGLGGRGAPAPSVDAAEMYQQLRPASTFPVPPGGEAPSPSIPYMPSTDPRGAAAPIPPPPRPAAPARPRTPMPPPAAPVPASAYEDLTAATPPGMAVNPMRPVPVPLANPNRVDPQMLARVLMRGVRPPIGDEMTALSPGSEMQVGPAPLGGMPVEAQADQIMRSVSRVNPQSFGQRYRQQMR